MDVGNTKSFFFELQRVQGFRTALAEIRQGLEQVHRIIDKLCMRSTRQTISRKG